MLPSSVSWREALLAEASGEAASSSVSHAAETVKSEVRVTSKRTEVEVPDQCAAVFTANSTEHSRRSAAIVQNARERRDRGL